MKQMTRALLGVPLLGLTLVTGACGTSGAGIGSDGGKSGRDEPDASADAPREAESSRGEAGGDGGCDPNIPLSATIVLINDPLEFKDLAPHPTACPGAGMACTYQDLQINFTTCAGSVDGFRFRYLRPNDASVTHPDRVPALISEPGSGACWVGQSTFDVVDETAATQGAIVLEVAPRGQFLCYLKGDTLYQSSDWLGPQTLGDYDRLLLAFTHGWVDPTYHADPAHLGIHGVSHGGLASFLYGRATHVPAVTGQPLALVMPELGNPDLASWSLDGFDTNDLHGIFEGTASASTPWGAMRLDGLVGWEFEYPGSAFATPFTAAVDTGDGVPTWEAQFLARSAHDDAQETRVKVFTQNTKHFLAVTATEDCIIPHQGTFDFYEQVKKATGGADARLLSPVAYHSCGDTAATLKSSYGYLPKVTGANSQLMGEWASSIRSAWISRYLIGDAPKGVGTSLPSPPDPGKDDPTAQPEWMFLLADEGLGADVPYVYTSAPPGALTTTLQTFALEKGATSVSGTSIDFDSATLSYNAATDTKLNLVTPTWNEAAAAEIDVDFLVTADDFVIIGQPDLTLFIHETSAPAADYSFTVILEDIRPGEAPWPIGSERRFSHTDTGAVTKQEIKMDTVKSRIKKGDTLRVAITNIALMDPVGGTHAAPMFAPSLNTFTAAFQSSYEGEESQLVLPTVPYTSLTRAPTTPVNWQIQQ
jgi:hypothetical protein